MSTRIPVLLLALLAVSAHAQNAPDNETPEIRRYTVEIIVFSYAQAVAGGSEIYVAETPATLDLTVNVEDKSEPVAPPIRREVDYVRLPKEDFTLTNIFERMQRLDVYKPLMHFGWTQSTLPKEDTLTRPLAAYARPPAGLSGDLTLYLSRYLHLAVDLQLAAPAAQNRSYRDFSDLELNAPIHYRINENRILRSGELRYFDHPKFGVLAKITRAEDAQDNGELLGDIGQ